MGIKTRVLTLINYLSSLKISPIFYLNFPKNILKKIKMEKRMGKGMGLALLQK